MSNLIVNVRFGYYHLQIERDYPFKIKWVRNHYWSPEHNPPPVWFEILS